MQSKTQAYYRPFFLSAIFHAFLLFFLFAQLTFTTTTPMPAAPQIIQAQAMDLPVKSVSNTKPQKQIEENLNQKMPEPTPEVSSQEEVLQKQEEAQQNLEQLKQVEETKQMEALKAEELAKQAEEKKLLVEKEALQKQAEIKKLEEIKNNDYTQSPQESQQTNPLLWQ